MTAEVWSKVNAASRIAFKKLSAHLKMYKENKTNRRDCRRSDGRMTAVDYDVQTSHVVDMVIADKMKSKKLMIMNRRVGCATPHDKQAIVDGIRRLIHEDH